MLRLTADQIFPRRRSPPVPEEYRSIYKVTGYSETENMWEYMCQIGFVKAQRDYKTATASLYKSATVIVPKGASTEAENCREEGDPTVVGGG